MALSMQTTGSRDALCERLAELWECTGHPALRQLCQGKDLHGELIDSDQEFVDWASTGLMDAYKDSGDRQVFDMLYQLNSAGFGLAIRGKVRRTVTGVDPADVLQDVFLNIYRYPHRFLAEKADSFRNWAYRIVRNTILKSLKAETKRARSVALDEELGSKADQRARSPLQASQHAESAELVDRAYLLYLNLYWVHFEKLSEKERRALTIVEVEGEPYKLAAAELGIRLENLKMVIFRGRRKILRGMAGSLAELEQLNPVQATR